ncbi:hypodermin-B-like isoform X1 [Temnothorax longispinosus]|uniref:hypodermin-B-like isoform X1 n=2 Tax=Temnothorax longispinosus TaxID=300112 RepID=UPI003A9A3F27
MDTCSFIFIFLCFARYLRYGLSSNAEQRIIKGLNTDIKLVPYMLSLRRNGRHICGAAIINEEWAVTAAHCIETSEDPLKGVTLCSGSSILYENCIVHNVTNFSIHENYDPNINDYDIAVIQVTPAFTYNDYTKAIDLPLNRHVSKEWGIVCGWGFYRKYHGEVVQSLSANLKCAKVPRVDHELCQKYYISRDYAVTPRMVCYGFEKGVVDACQGDSGGPIERNNILLGITSWGDDCGEKYSPGVYTDVILFRYWIKMKTGMEISPHFSRNLLL